METHAKADRMESFFLAETTKYLYLLFDEDNFIHKSDGSHHSHNNLNYARNHVTEGCPIGSSGYIFNTEAHPLDIAAVHCCKNRRRKEFFERWGDDINEAEIPELLKQKKLTGKYKCKKRPFHAKFFGLGAYLEDSDSIFQKTVGSEKT